MKLFINLFQHRNRKALFNSNNKVNNTHVKLTTTCLLCQLPLEQKYIFCFLLMAQILYGYGVSYGPILVGPKGGSFTTSSTT